MSPGRTGAEWFAIGNRHARRAEFHEARRCFEAAVCQASDQGDAWHNLGATLNRLGEQPLAAEAYKRALYVDPQRADSYVNLGNMLLDAGQLLDAAECFDRAQRIEPGLGTRRSQLAEQLLNAGHVQRAAAMFRQSLSLDPRHRASWVGLGRTLEDAGDERGALVCYRHILEQDGKHAFAMSQYFSLFRGDAEPSLLKMARSMMAEQPDKPRALVGYGLAQYHDRRGELALAAECAISANAARRRTAGPLDRAAIRTRVDRIIATYDADFFFARRSFGVATEQPVFIVGLPRSGTTLCEQIVASHPDCHGAGELDDLTSLALEATDAREHRGQAWSAASALDVMASRHFALRYLRALRNSALKDRRRITDKSPFNFFNLAFIAVLFPQCRIIHCTRNAADRALSIWLQNFNVEQRYATDFADLAFFTDEYSRLMAHWRKVLPLKILELRYEDTVTDLEANSRDITTFLDIDWHPACLDFHRNDRSVQTPSRWQVRQPIYSSSVDRWKAYARHVPELETAFPAL